MLDVISVTLEANISSRTTSAFKTYDRLVNNLGKSVLNFKKHTGAVESSVKRLNTALGRKTGFSAFDQKLVSSAKKVKALKGEVTSLRDTLIKLSDAFKAVGRASSAPMSRANTNLQAVRRSATQTAAAYRAARTQLQGLQNQAGRSVNGVRMPNVNFYGGRGGGGGPRGPRRTGLGGMADISPTRWLQFGGSAAILGGGMMGVGKGIIGAATNIFSAGIELEKAVASFTARLNAEDRRFVPALEKEASRLSNQFGLMPSEIIASFEEAAAMGVAGKDMAMAGNAITMMSQAADMTAERSARGLGMVLASFGYRNAEGGVDFNKAMNLGKGGPEGFKQDGTGLVDVISYVADKTQTNEAELMRAFEYSGATFKAAGLDVVKSAVYLGAASNVARTGSKGGRDMAEIFSRVSRTKTAETAKQELGVDFVDPTGNVKDALTLMAELGASFDSYTKGGTQNMAKALDLQREIFGEQGLKAYAAFQASLESSNVLQNELINGAAKGWAANKAAIKTDSLHYDLIRLQGAWQSFSNAILGTSHGPLNKFIGLLVKGLNVLTKFVEKHPMIAQAILAGVVAAGAFLVVGGAMLTLVGTLGFAVGGIGSAFELATVAFGRFAVLRRLVMLRNGVTGLATRFPLLSGGIARVGTFFSSVFGSGAGGMAARFLALRGGMTALLGSIGPIGWAIGALSLIVWKFWGPIKAFMVGVYDGYYQALQPALEEMKAAFTELWAALQPGIDALIALVSPVDASAETLGTAAKMGQLLGGVMAKTVIPIARAMTTAIEAATWVISKITKYWDYFKFVIWDLNPFVMLFKALGWVWDKIWEGGAAIDAWAEKWLGWLDPIIEKLQTMISLVTNPLDAVMHPVDTFNKLTGSGKDPRGYFSGTTADAFSATRTKLVNGGALDRNGTNLSEMNTGKLGQMISSGQLTNRDLLSIKSGNATAPENKRINLSKEQQAYIDSIEKEVAAASNDKAAQAKILNSSPTINITVNGGGDPQAIAAAVKDAVTEQSRTEMANMRSIFGNDNYF